MTETLAAALPPDLDDALRALLDEACRREMTLATAESCTGGLIASLLTDVPGCSHAFERGFVVYTAAAKSQMLGIPPEVIDRYGAVSREVAEAMAAGGLDRSAADLCLSVTGFAGPSGPGEEAGLVHFGCALRGGPLAHRVAHFGDIGRGRTRIAAVGVAVEMMRQMVGSRRGDA